MAGSPTPYADNPLGVRVSRPLNFDAPGSPATKTYHGVVIVVNGNVVGRIQNWNPQMYTREGSHVYELNNLTFGRPVDYVPSINTGYTISASRTEVWYEEFEIALGYPAVWADLIDQDQPFACEEYIFRGQTVYRSWLYRGCWFQDKNQDAFDAQGDAKVKVNATINFVSRTLGVSASAGGLTF